ncbi:hypothetical protein EV401DRAFT_1915250 [Pisolithus croceorrhizus]|nr:hypothetical protein EV401DRAFT_1915250 [Pisolithus croceorrhizus]
MSLLASFSLFALVVGRPILSGTELDVRPFLEAEAAQTTFRTDAGKDAYRSDAARVSFMASDDGKQNEYLFQVIPSTGEPVVSLKDLSTLEHTDGESRSNPYTASDKQIYGFDVVHSNEEMDDPLRTPTNPSVGVSRSATFDSNQRRPTFSLLVLALSCVAAFLALACILLVLYITKFLISHMLASRRTWQLLPHFRKLRAPFPQPETTVTHDHTQLDSCRLVEKCGLYDEETAKYADTTSDMDSDGDDTEKFQDALDMTPIHPACDLPLDVTGTSTDHPTERLQPPPAFSCFQTSPRDPNNPVTRELSSTTPPRLSWSDRASASPPVPSRLAHDEAILPLVHGRRRAYRSAVPEFDIALALQLHPGLGIGADSAWVVRFLMSIFGWFAVALSANR